jgi:hypothetical protein
VVQNQLDAYNSRDIERLLQLYAKDAQIFEFPATLVATGTAALRERFSARFLEPNLHAKLLNRIVAGHLIVDHEEVTRTFPEGPGKLELTMIYEVLNGQIIRAWTITAPRTLDNRT